MSLAYVTFGLAWLMLFIGFSFVAALHPIVASFIMTSCLVFVIYRYKSLEEASEHVLHDIDDLIGNSQGVAGLHLNGDVAEWESLLKGGEFHSWLTSLEDLRNVLK